MTFEYEIKVREPYMGNQVPLKVVVTIEDYGPPKVIIVNSEGIYHTANYLEKDDG